MHQIKEAQHLDGGLYTIECTCGFMTLHQEKPDDPYSASVRVRAFADFNEHRKTVGSYGVSVNS